MFAKEFNSGYDNATEVFNRVFSTLPEGAIERCVEGLKLAGDPGVVFKGKPADMGTWAAYVARLAGVSLRINNG